MTDFDFPPIESRIHQVDGQPVDLQQRIRNAASSVVGYWLECEGMLISGGHPTIIGQDDDGTWLVRYYTRTRSIEDNKRLDPVDLLLSVSPTQQGTMIVAIANKQQLAAAIRKFPDHEWDKD